MIPIAEIESGSLTSRCRRFLRGVDIEAVLSPSQQSDHVFAMAEQDQHNGGDSKG